MFDEEVSRMGRMIRMIALVGQHLRLRHLVVAGLLASTSVNAADLAAARADLEAGRFDQVEAAVEDLADDDADAAFLLGRVRYQQREWEDAGDLFEEAVGMGRDDSETQVWLGRARVNEAQEASIFRRMGIASDAKDAFERAVELDPENVDALASLIDYLVGAPGIAGGDKDRARELIATLESMDPWEAVDARAGLLRSEDEDADLIPLYEEAVASMPEHVEARFTLGLMYVQAERYDEADAAFIATQALQPDHRGVMYQFGKYAAVTGQALERGAEQLTRFLATPEDPDEPSHAWARYRLGMIYEHQAETEMAMASYRTARELDPEHDDARSALRRLERGG
jgi:tetratricopeptide (TPR) repeat protein